MNEPTRSGVHPTAVVSEDASIGKDTRIWHFCHVMGGAKIGANCVLGQNVFVASTVQLGDGCRVQNNVSLYDGVVAGYRVFIGPSAVFTNVIRPRAGFPRKDQFQATRLGDDVTIGANATIRCGIELGEGAFVAAGAVVTRSVPPFVLVGGVPAQRMGFVCRCGERLKPEESQPQCLRCALCARQYDQQGEGLRERGVSD
jgi:UDP-2-acetamido-3-amino-2,3-dideoxy-glucuronate N-acetyltransferase